MLSAEMRTSTVVANDVADALAQAARLVADGLQSSEEIQEAAATSMQGQAAAAGEQAGGAAAGGGQTAGARRDQDAGASTAAAGEQAAPVMITCIFDRFTLTAPCVLFRTNVLPAQPQDGRSRDSGESPVTRKAAEALTASRGMRRQLIAFHLQPRHLGQFWCPFWGPKLVYVL